MDREHVVVMDQNRANDYWVTGHVPSFIQTGNTSVHTVSTTFECQSPAPAPRARVAWRRRQVLCLRWHWQEKILISHLQAATAEEWRNAA